MARNSKRTARNTQSNTPAAEAATRPIPNVERTAYPTTGPQPDSLVVPLIEETLQAKKEWVQAGEVQIRKRVETTTETLPVDLGYEEALVERVPVNRLLKDGERAEPRQEGDTLIVPVIEEELVVVKRYRVREEVRITKLRASRREEVSDTVRREEVEIQSVGNVTTDSAQRGAR